VAPAARLCPPQCCREFANGTRCPAPDQPPCSQEPDACAECTPCFAPGDLPGGRPDLQQFQVSGGWVGGWAMPTGREAEELLLPANLLVRLAAGWLHPPWPVQAPPPSCRRRSCPGSCSRCPLRAAPRAAQARTPTRCSWMETTPRGWRGWGRGAWWPPPPSAPATSPSPARQTSSPRCRWAEGGGGLPGCRPGRAAWQ
jgi:hypothetical protein